MCPRLTNPRFYSTNNSDIELSEKTRLKIIALLQQHTKGRLFSLTTYIGRRRQLVANTLPQEERDVLAALDRAQRGVESLNTDDVNVDDFKGAYKAFDQAWFEAREYYISRSARGMIATAATATSKMFRYYNPITVVIEEAAQMSEALAVATLSRNEHSALKVVLVGDPNQNKPFTLNMLSEFTATQETSLMERLMKTGVPTTRLLVQYRMHPDIADTVSKFFYSNELINSLHVQRCPADAIWERFHQIAFRRQPLQVQSSTSHERPVLS